MSRHERRYQKYLGRKQQKHGTDPREMAWTAEKIAPFAHYPIHETLVPARLFETGMGNLLFSRSIPNGCIVWGAFLLDTYCLGVKNAFAGVVSKQEYAERSRTWRAAESLQPIDAACFRKLIEGGVAYAQSLGFNPHPDYAAARQLFGDVLATACATQFTYGHEGMPLYVSGPNDTPERVQSILAQLERRVGPGNFHYIVGGPF